MEVAELVRAWQGELAVDARFQRTCVERVLQVCEAKTGEPPILALCCK